MMTVPEEIVEAPPTNYDEADRVLARRLPGYEPRPQQVAGAHFVERALADGGLYLAQAGTGVGKSYMAMIPAILHAIATGRKVIIAIPTKALQEQYYQVDVPFLTNNLGVDFQAAVLKGRGSYVCLAKLDEVTESELPGVDLIRKELADDEEHSGDRDHFAATIDERRFGLISSSSNECPGKSDCPFGQVCYAERAKQRARRANVIITNVSMLATDLTIKRMAHRSVEKMFDDYEEKGYIAGMLPIPGAVIMDEAHEVADYVASALTAEFKQATFDDLVARVDTYVSSLDIEFNSGSAVIAAADAVWALLPSPKKITEATARVMRQSFFYDNVDTFAALTQSLEAMKTDVLRAVPDDDHPLKDKLKTKRKMLLKRVDTLLDKIREVVLADDDTYVRWTELETRRYRGQVREIIVVKAVPVDVSPFLRDWLWGPPATGIGISATLKVGDDFSYTARTLGMDDVKTLDVGTAFDYPSQALTYVPPKTAKDPRDGEDVWLPWATAIMGELVRASGGGALLLFTSKRSMRYAYETLGDVLRAAGYQTLLQGPDSTNRELAQRFLADRDSVLFGTKSFMTGVSFPGDSCRLVVIDKLPFARKDDPLMQAKQDAVTRRGGSWFRDLVIPNMTLVLEQAYGRLIRTKTDRGVVAILDSRLTKLSYGKGILRNLPPAPRTTDLADVRAFFQG
jgi:ATP-dependent DNA helicase DinG